MIRKILMGLAAVVGFTTVATATTPIVTVDGDNVTIQNTLGNKGGYSWTNPTGNWVCIPSAAELEAGSYVKVKSFQFWSKGSMNSNQYADRVCLQANGVTYVSDMYSGSTAGDQPLTYSFAEGNEPVLQVGKTNRVSFVLADGKTGLRFRAGEEGCGSDGFFQVGGDANYAPQLILTAEKVAEPPAPVYESVVSMNFGASSYNVPADTDPGSCVNDSNWYNLNGNNVTDAEAGSLLVSYSGSGNYQNTDRIPVYLKGYLDDNGAGLNITVKNLETAPYDIYIYCNSDNASGWAYKTINGKNYTADATGKGVLGTGAWGNNSNKSEVLGKNVMVVENIYPDAEGKIAIASVRNGTVRGCITAIQICENPAAPTYEAEIDEETDWKDIDWEPSKPEGGFEDNAVLKLKVNGKTTLMFSEILNIPQRLEINDDSENALTLKAADALFTDGCYEKTIATFGSFVPGCAKVSEELPAGFSGAYALTDSGFKVRAQNREVISINIGGGKITAGGSYDPQSSPTENLVPSDDNYYGVAPTLGKTWNNIDGMWKNKRSTVTLEGSIASAPDGTVTNRPTIDLSATATTTWQADISNYFLRGYLDDGDGLEVAVHGVPYTKYDVIVYATSDATSAVLSPITVNGAQYTFVDGETVKGSTIWGKALCNVPAIGDNALYIKDCTGEQLTISAAKTTGGRGTLCAVQVINQGEILIRSEYYGEMDGDVVWTDGKTAGNLTQLGDDWVNGQLSTITITNTVEGATFSFGAETIGQQIKFVSEYPITIDAKSMVQYGKLGIYDFTEVEGGAIFQLPEGEAFDAANLPTTIKGEWKFSKDGILVFDGKLPTAAEQAFFTNEVDWAGTVWIKNIRVSGNVFNDYGNANSKLRFTGVKGWFNFSTPETTLPIELVDEGETRALEVTDGSLNKAYIFDKVTGSGSINVSSVHTDPFIVQIKDVSEYTGKITSLDSTTPDGDATKAFPILIGEMEGALPYGATSKITVADGAAINTGCEWEAESAAFGATLMLMSGAEGGCVINGLTMEAPVYLATKVLYPEESNPDFSCLGYEDDAIWLRKPVAFSIKDCDNTTFTVEGAFYQETGPFTAYYYAAKGAPVKVTYTTNEGYFFSDGTTTKVVETTVTEDMDPIEVEGEAKKYVAQIGEECFESLNDAFESAAYGDTIFLLQNASIEKSIDLVYDEGYYWDCTLDMNGKTITPGYNPDKDAYKPMFNVSSNATLTITGNGTIAGWEGALGKEYDGRAVIVVDGGFLYYLNGTLTAGGEGSDGMYGVYVCGNGTARFGADKVEGGPSITTWFAAIGANNLNPGEGLTGVDIIVYGGTYTQLATPAEGDWWRYFCAAIYAPANGKYDIKGGTFTGALYSFSTRYANVDQDVWFYGGTYDKPLFVGEKTGEHPCAEPDREIWKDYDVTLDVVPDGYVWDGRGYLMKAACAINRLGVDYYYATIQEAFNGVQNGETIKMLKDIALTNGIDLVYDEGYAWYCTFDMDGHTLTAKYDRDAATCKPVFNVSSNAFFTITGNGTIAGWTGADAAKYDGNAVIEVDGGWLYYLNGTLTAGGVGSDGMYGVYVLGSGTAEFGTNGGVGTTGPTISTWFAPIGANNTTPGALGVTIRVYEGAYTQLATPAEGDWWRYFCAAIYAPAKGTYEIKGGTFNGTVGSIALPYNNVGQAVRLEGGTFVKALYVGEKTATVGGGERLVWKDDKLSVNLPAGYYWDSEGYMVHGVAKNGDDYYESLNDAFADAGMGDTIELLQDVALTNGIDLVWGDGTAAWSCTLDMKGKTITPGYTTTKAAYVPLFNVASNVTFTITGNGTIAGWTGSAAAALDGKAIISVEGKGWLKYENGTLTAGGVGSDGMYGVYVCGDGTAWFGKQDVAGGPTITSWFAPIGANNTNPGTKGVDIIVYDGTFTQKADGTGQWWSYFCAAIYAPADGSYDIRGGEFTGALYAIATRYSNVDQTITIYGGTYNQPLFADEVQGAGTGTRSVWKDSSVTLGTTGDYYWDDNGYLVKGGEPEPVPPGEFKEEFETQAAAEACVAVIDANKALYIKAPGDAPTTDAYLALFSAKSTFDSGSGKYVVTIELNAEGQETLQDQADADVAAAIADPTATTAEIATIPGLYYTFEGGTDVKDITTPGETTLATEEKTIVPKPDLGETNQAFYQLKVDTAE